MDAADPRSQDAEKVRLLTVCTGNICRSPYAAVMLREGLAWARPGAFEVTSAGTHALVGWPMDEGSVRVLQVKGLSDDGFRARLVTPQLLLDQAAVLVLSSEHKALVLDEAPAVHRRTFTLLELAHVLDDIGERHGWPQLMEQAGAHDVVARWQRLPSVVSAHRGRSRQWNRDVGDPYKRGDRAFEQMSAEVDPAVRSIVMWERQFER